MYVRLPLSLRNVEDLLFERPIDSCQETVGPWWNRFGRMFTSDIRHHRHCRRQTYKERRFAALPERE